MKRIQILVAWIAGLSVFADVPQIVNAVRIGTESGDRLEGVAFAPDGTLLVAGTLGTAPAAPVLGAPVADAQYRVGFVGRLDASGSEWVNKVAFAPGIAHVTTVVPAADGSVYVAGYANRGLEPLIAGQEPLIGQAATRQKALTRWAPWVHRHDPQIDADRHDERGVPFVLRLDETLSEVTGGTFLEGWQSVWHVPHPLGEDQWQPVELVVLPDGDVIVAHDGGILSDHGDRAPDVRDFYGVPDHLSRLSADLRTRRWHREVYTPPNDPEKVRRHLGYDWDQDTLGNTRIHRMRLSPDGGRFTIVGWSPSETSREPWWAPFCFEYTVDGTRRMTLFTPSPMAGGEDRMGNLVSDSAVSSVYYDDEGDLLLVVKGDGGNSILRQDPRDFERGVPEGAWRSNLWGFAGRTLFWGGVVRVRGEDGAFVRGTAFNGRGERNRLTPAWPVDMVPIPDGRVVMAGRHSTGFSFSNRAWRTDTFPARRPGGMLVVMQPDLGVSFSSSLGDVQPFRTERQGHRVAVAGMARSGEVLHTLDLGLTEAEPGGTMGWLLVLELEEAQP